MSTILTSITPTAVRRRTSVIAATVIAMIATVVSAPIAAVASPSVGPSDSAIRYVGRWDKSSSSQYLSYWGGAYFKVGFSGQTVGLELGAPADILVSIDGSADVLYTAATGTVNLTPSALTSGPHTLRVAARYQDDSIRFGGLHLATGGTTFAPAMSDKLIEFIGDSITAGINNTNKALSDYAWLAAEQLHAEHTQIAYSGICLVNRSCYDQNTTGMSTQFFKREPITGATQTNWNFAASQPTAVVINMGTNDQLYGTPVAPGVFQSTYVTFLQNVRAVYPDAEIFAMRTLNGYFALETYNAVNAVVAQGDTRVHFVNTDGWVESSDFHPSNGDTVHPIDTGHQKIASKLAATLAPYLYSQSVSSPSYAPALEDFRNTSDWVAGDDANAVIYTTGTAAQVSLKRNGGLTYGSVAKQVSYDVDTSPYLSIRVNSVTNPVGAVPGGQWGLKVNDGSGADIQLQGVTSQTGLLSYDLRGATGWRGAKSFKIKLFVLNNSVEVSSISIHTPQLARGSHVTASSTVNGNLPASVADGDPNTRWESATSNLQWITVDLGRDMTVDSAVIRWETASAKSFEVQVSRDGSTWAPVYSTSAGPGGDQSILFPSPVTARYVRIDMTQRNTQWAYSIWEFEVYRHDLAVAAPVEVSSAVNGNAGQYLTDANPTTRWETQTLDPQGVIVDLGSSQQVGRVLLNWETASAKAFEIWVSNDRAKWTTVSQTTAGPGGVQPVAFTPTKARYVFVYMTQRNTQWAYSLWDLEIYPY